MNLLKKIKPKPSIVYNTYWKFATERQNIFFKRINGEESPWTSDAILNQYKFTSVYRVTDRVSQYLLQKVVYKGCQDNIEIFFRLILFKIFNSISTWEELETKLGTINFEEYTFKKYDKILSSLLNENKPIYSSAYIMPSGKSTFGYQRKHQNHLRLIESMIKDKLPSKLQQCKSMENAYNLLLSYPSVGTFLAYQYVTDVNYSSLVDFSEMEFVKAGPGAISGIEKCFKDLGDYTYEDVIRIMTDRQEEEFAKLGLEFKNLWGRKLQLIDCQNLFCEVDKYSRIAHPNIKGYSDRTRIKRKFICQKKEKIEYFFPPKWNLYVTTI